MNKNFGYKKRFYHSNPKEGAQFAASLLGFGKI
jgi:hypothetical protein